MAQFQYFIEGVHPAPGELGNGTFYFKFRYLGSGTIKYITITIDFINQVGDVFYSKKIDKITGPINANDVRSIDIGDYELDYKYRDAIKSGAHCVGKRVSAKIDFIDAKKSVVSSDFEECTYRDKDKWWKAKSGGCYVATCVYGSYDCPEVWTLRRYRDNTLSSTWYGRLFIKTYYAISPTLVKRFGKTRWFKKLWRGKLDRMVKNLQERGVENTPYQDKEW